MPLYLNNTGTIVYIQKDGRTVRIPMNSTIELTEIEAKNAGPGFLLVSEVAQKAEAPKNRAINPVNTIKNRVSEYATDTLKNAVEKLLPELMDKLKADDGTGELKELNKKLDVLLSREPQTVVIQGEQKIASKNTAVKDETMYIPDIRIDDSSTKEVRVKVDAQENVDNTADSIAALKKMKKKTKN